MISHKHIVSIGKVVRHASRLRGGTGSALPGLVVEKLDPDFAARTLANLPQGVVVVTGTNGKTTTTKIICELLRAHGLHVFTNQTGSNFTRGIIASLLKEVDRSGTLSADIAVLELDEAYAVHFVKRIRPRYALLLNVMRDQLDRFGEIDTTARLLQTVADTATDGVVLNKDDPLISRLVTELPHSLEIRMFGIAPKLRSLFPDDQQLYGHKPHAPVAKTTTRPGDVTLDKIDGSHAWFRFGNAKTPHRADLKLRGIYNMQNAASALCLARMVLGDTATPRSLIKALGQIMPAFGRGEALLIDGQPLEIILVKNPAGFRLALTSYKDTEARTMIAINDNYADGRDMSWLWDVDFSQLKHVAVVSGTRAYDMALRLQYDEVEVGQVEPSLASSLSILLKHPPSPRRIFCTYTAMMQLRKLLSKKHAVEAIDT